MKYHFRPIQKWPWLETEVRKVSPFRASYSNTLNLLASELYWLSAEDVVIQADVSESEIRMDGMLRADAKPRSDRLVLSFESDGHPLMFPCDTFYGWKNNLRAIAMGLKALRAVDRYGITQHREQYTGWKQLPGGNVDEKNPTIEASIAFFAEHSRVAEPFIWDTPTWRRKAYRQAAQKLHPDRGGNAELFKQLQVAKRVLDEHFQEARHE